MGRLVGEPVNKFFRVVTAPVRVPVRKVRNLANLVRAANQAEDIWNQLEEASVNKSLWSSKTFWVNVLTAVIALIGMLPLPPQYAVPVVCLVNIALRIVTGAPIEFWAKFMARLAEAANDELSKKE